MEEELSSSFSSVKIIITNDCSVSIPTTASFDDGNSTGTTVVVGGNFGGAFGGSKHSSLCCQLGESPTEYQRDTPPPPNSTSSSTYFFIKDRRRSTNASDLLLTNRRRSSMNSVKDTVVETPLVQQANHRWSLKTKRIQQNSSYGTTRILPRQQQNGNNQQSPPSAAIRSISNQSSKKYRNRRPPSLVANNIRRVRSYSLQPTNNGSVKKANTDDESSGEKLSQNCLGYNIGGSLDEFDETECVVQQRPSPRSQKQAFRMQRLFSYSSTVNNAHLPKLTTQMSSTSCYGSTELARQDSGAYEVSTNYWDPETPQNASSNWSFGG